MAPAGNEDTAMSTLEPRPGRESYGEGSAEVHALHANCALCGSWFIFARSLGELAAGEGSPQPGRDPCPRRSRSPPAPSSRPGRPAPCGRPRARRSSPAGTACPPPDALPRQIHRFQALLRAMPVTCVQDAVSVRLPGEVRARRAGGYRIPAGWTAAGADRGTASPAARRPRPSPRKGLLALWRPQPGPYAHGHSKRG